ncbi:MmcQ/YjbR family DNA-binding protein [Luteolibacter algae]|uniref:MmcQ/YjbR family DNA-binding protein n=1 Tax=Luteolibacter algae TaxID=454151 RepID=A0ABW5D508_9BACT
MSPSALANLLHALPYVEETTPFGPEVLVQKVGDKMFACYPPVKEPLRLNLKCDPERAIEMREKYEEITPGYHMNKRHSNTLLLDGTLPPELVKELVEHSYDLVMKSLTRKKRDELSQDRFP